MTTKSQFLDAQTDDFLTRSLTAVVVDTRAGVTQAFAQEVQYIKDHSPSVERASVWADKVLKTDDSKPKAAVTPRRTTPGSGMKG